MKNLTLSFLVSVLIQFSFGQQKSEVYTADLGNGFYQNPILHADYSDPDVIAVGDDFFMTSSSFNAAPGLPILHSKDMVNWALINHALPYLSPRTHFETPQHGKGVWAPSIRYHNDSFYIFWGDPDSGIYMVKTKDPYGKWDAPVLVLEGKGLIDPCPFWDDDGQAYLIHAWAGSRAGVKSLLTVRKLSNDGTKILDDGVHVFDGHGEHFTVEGPKMYKRKGWYYIFAPAGGVPTGWQLALRSKDPYGPYELKKVLEQGSTNINGPHQGAWVTYKNTDWFYHFQDKEAYGRVVHLQPMKWKNDWPIMGKDYDANGVGEPVLKYKKPIMSMQTIAPVESDEFTAEKLGLQWQWNANPRVNWYAKLRGTDFLRLFAIRQTNQMDNLLSVPNLLLQKFPAPNFKATTKLSLNPETLENVRAGIIILGNDYSTLYLTHKEEGVFLEQSQTINANKGAREKVIESIKVNQNSLWLAVEIKAPDGSVNFSYSRDGDTYIPIGIPATATVGGWIGSKVGLFCSKTNKKVGGYADFQWFRISK
jgi:beta-xylosidase